MYLAVYQGVIQGGTLELSLAMLIKGNSNIKSLHKVLGHHNMLHLGL